MIKLGKLSVAIVTIMVLAVVFSACRGSNPTSVTTSEPSQTSTSTLSPASEPSQTSTSTLSPASEPSQTSTSTLSPASEPSQTSTPALPTIPEPELFLEVLSPTDESILEIKEIEVEGKTLATAIVSVNGVLTTVNESGSFLANVTLNEGPNLIEIVASDVRGNERGELLTVIYMP